MDGAFDRTPYSASLRTDSEVVSAPVEDYDTAFTAPYPCDPNYSIDYDNLLQWWKDYIACNSVDEGGDVTMLITGKKANGGGRVNLSGGEAHVQTGKLLVQCPSTYQEYGMGDKYRAMRTVHHEFGHYAMGDVDYSHDWGDTFTHGTSDHYMTPMYVQAGANQCGESVEQSGDRGWEQVWSDCCQTQW